MTSAGARGGFANERAIINDFNNFDPICFPWVEAMGYEVTDVKKIIAKKAPPMVKPDIQIELYGPNHVLLGTEFISAKLQSSKRGFNQIDRGDIDTRYRKLWPQMSDSVAYGLKLFTGKISPLPGSRNTKRMFVDELDLTLRNEIFEFFRTNLQQVASDLLAGRHPFRANWMMVSNKENSSSAVLAMEQVIEMASQGGVHPTPRQSISIGIFTAQRKGGDGGAETAKHLQFKIDPGLLVN